MSLRVLIIDNDSNHISLIKQNLTFRTDAEVDEAQNSNGALRLIEAKSYDIIFLDLMLIRGSFDPALRILDMIFNHDSTRQGLVFIISDYVPSLDSDPEIRDRLNSYPLVTDPIDFSKLLVQTRERDLIQFWINEVSKIVDRHAVQNTQNIAYNFFVYTCAVIILLGGWLYLPSKLNNYSTLTGFQKIMLSSIPAIFFSIIFFWDKAKILLLKWVGAKS
tara:strand:+ start:70 stop:726 length:657 start_codon:yes stop_codon:yes gene_type:complete